MGKIGDGGLRALFTRRRSIGCVAVLVAVLAGIRCGERRPPDEGVSVKQSALSVPLPFTLRLTTLTIGLSNAEREIRLDAQVTVPGGTTRTQFLGFYFPNGSPDPCSGCDSFSCVGCDQGINTVRTLPVVGATPLSGLKFPGTLPAGSTSGSATIKLILSQVTSFPPTVPGFTATFTIDDQGNASQTCIAPDLTANRRWGLCWTIDIPCKGQTSIACQAPPSNGCPTAPGHAVCNGLIPGPCVADPVPPGSGLCNALFPYDLVPNQPAGQPSVSDDNGILLNPRWGWQVPSATTPPICCSHSQPTTINSGCDVTNTLAFFTGGLIESSQSPWHENWMDATYTGRLHWDDHSFDDDYNISIIPPVVPGTSFPAGMTPDNVKLGNIQSFIQSEFDSDETIDDFDSASIPWWIDFHQAVDAGGSLASNRIDGHDAVITGRMGTDDFHGNKSELHPVHFFAVRQAAVPNPNDDAWSFFYRNWGNEGFCGEGQENLDIQTARIRLPRPPGIAANADFTIGPKSVARGTVTTTVPILLAPASNGDTIMTVQLDPPSAQKWSVGEVHLIWGPPGPLPSPAPPPVATFDGDQEPEAIIPALLTSAQNAFAKALYRGMVARTAPLQPQTLQFAKTSTPPPPSTTPPTSSVGPASARTLMRRRAQQMAACVAAGGSLGGGFCSDPTVRPGAGVCLLASGSVSVDDRVSLTNPDGSLAAISNAGTGDTNIGVSARVGAISAVGPVFLRSNATSGTIATGATVTLQTGTTHGTIQEHQSLQLPNAGLAITFPSSQGKPTIDVQPGTPPMTISPGSYQSVSVKTNATLVLPAGTYFFDSLMVEPSGKISVDSKTSAVAIYVRNGFTTRGSFVEKTGGKSNLFIGVQGTSGAVLGAPFQGVVIAPNGLIDLNTVAAPGFSGSFMGKSIIVHQDNNVVCAPF
jgi:hypothetical protein